MLRITSSDIKRLPIRIGIIAFACSIRWVARAIYLNNTYTRIIFIPPLVEPPIPPINIKHSNKVCAKYGQSS